METFYASPERESIEELLLSTQKIIEVPFLVEILDSLPHFLLLVNQDRQVVFSNNALVQYLSLDDYKDIIAKRPGEVFHCVNANKMKAGCGTSKNCRYCGAVNALLDAQKSKRPCSHECRIRMAQDGVEISKTFKVEVTPYKVSNSYYYFFFIEDISRNKRLEQFEFSFLHDLGNYFSALNGMLYLFPKENMNSIQIDELEKLLRLSNIIHEEIHAQQDISRINGSDVSKNETVIRSYDLIKECVNIIGEFNETASKQLIIDNQTLDVSLTLDEIKFRRILINLLKNALEASNSSETVSIGCDKEKNYLSFWVHNSAYIPENIQMQMFQFSFSTKGSGRGIGLYSSKNLVEQVLGGILEFTTSKSEGTTFTVKIKIK